MSLNIYHLWRTDDIDWDEYSDFVVIAESEDEARRTSPRDGDGPIGNNALDALGPYAGRVR